MNQVETLTRVCVDDLLSSFGLGGMRRGRRLLMLACRPSAQRLARQIVTYDQIVGEAGLRVGGAWALKRMVRRADIEGRERIPTEGPLLLLANHPGLADSVALFSSIPRSDLRVVAAKWPLLEALPNTSRHLIKVVKDPPNRFAVCRSIARHLLNNGAVLSFPAGRMEPDPALLPGALSALERWSPSTYLFARLIPNLTIIPVAVGGVLSPIALRNPITYLRRRDEDRWWLASNLQMLVPALRNVTVRVRFGHALSTVNAENAIRQRVLAEMRFLIEGLTEVQVKQSSTVSARSRVP